MQKDKSFRQFKKKNTLKNMFNVAVAGAISVGHGVLVYSNYEAFAEPNILRNIFTAGIVAQATILGVFLSKTYVRAGDVSFDDDISAEDKIHFESLYTQTGMDKQLHVSNVNSPSANYVAMVDASSVIFNQYRFSQMNRAFKNEVIAHELSHVQNNDDLVIGSSFILGAATIFNATQALVIDNYAVIAIGAACSAIQLLLNKKLSRQIEERAFVEGAYQTGIGSDGFFQNRKALMQNLAGCSTHKYKLSEKKTHLMDTHPSPKKVHSVVKRVLG